MNPSQKFKKKRVSTYEIDHDYGVGDVIADALFYAKARGWNPRHILRLALNTFEANKPCLDTPEPLGFISGYWVHRARDLSGNAWYCRHQNPVFLNIPPNTQWLWAKPKRVNWRWASDSWGYNNEIQYAKPITIREPSSWAKSWNEARLNSAHLPNNNSTVLVFSDGTVWYEYSPENAWHNLRDELDPKAVLVHITHAWNLTETQLRKLDRITLKRNVRLERQTIAETLAENPQLAEVLIHVPLPDPDDDPEVAHMAVYAAFY